MNYFADQKYTDIYCSEQDLADRLGVTRHNLRTMITDGSVPPGDAVISNGDGVEHCYTEETTINVIMNSHKINPTQNKEIDMQDSITNTSDKRKINRLNNSQIAAVNSHLMKNFGYFNKPSVTWRQASDKIEKDIGIRVNEGSMRKYMEAAAALLDLEVKPRNGTKISNKPSSKAGAGTIVLEDGTMLKITLLGKRKNKNA